MLTYFSVFRKLKSISLTHFSNLLIHFGVSLSRKLAIG
ncbi:hypothetical protein COO91_06926 [Nostoc flagelliforme CCNUN1]|uniref:Uncharacterized protein n=1 Tax=Nostoc flagelliforme CCNUN1 TaxID=2038116 RepID=A0A2K8SZT8_9NOSO|nr:hypothetical protein COO91_06926 [Nostoc flagelliforme CCNUN1]